MKIFFLTLAALLMSVVGITSPVLAQTAPAISATPTGTETIRCVQSNVPKTCTINQIGSSIFSTMSMTAGSDTGIVSRTLQSRFQDETSVSDFCSPALETGITDATACIQAAVTAVCSRTQGAGILFFPSALFLVNGTVTIPCSGIQFIGSGRGNRDLSSHGTKILAGASGGANPVFYFNVTSPAGNYSYGAVVRDMGFSAASGRIGAMIRMDHVQGGLVDNVYFWVPTQAVKFFSGLNLRVTNFVVDQFQNGYAFECEGADNNGADRLDICSFDHGIASQQNSMTSGGCFHIKDFANTVWISNTGCETSSYALFSECPTLTNGSNCPAFFTLNDFEAEGFGPTSRELLRFSDTHLIKINGGFMGSYDGQLGVSNIMSFRQVRFANSGGVDIQGAQIYGAAGSCIYTRLQDTKVMGGQIYNCGLKNDIPYYGVEAGVDTVNSTAAISGHLNVQGVSFCKTPNGTSAGTNTYPIAFLAGTAANLATGNIFLDCAHPSITDSSGASDNITANNISS